MKLMVAAENAEQARAWDGDEGDHWTEHEERYDNALRAYREVYNQRTAIRPGEDVLDVGCGTGQSSRDAAAHAGSVLGVDLSARMIARAIERSAGYPNVTFWQADAQIYPFEPGAFDTVVSRTGAMFFGDRTAAFTNLARALRPGGRMTLLAWQALPRNEWLMVIRDCLAAGRDLPMPPPEAPSPFGLSEPALVEPVLKGAGFADVSFEAVDRPFFMGTDTADATAFATGTGVAQWLLSTLAEDQRAAATDRVYRAMAEHESPDGVQLGSSCWLITAVRP
jgi:SAM-dependent methyltransferase